ncbi:hypothetical protein ABBQ38_014074 [Trebouxia sp. C0009 RCD-2024]
MAALLETTTLPVTALYAGILSILFAYLALRVGLTRASTGVMHGDNGKQDMVRKARAQGNLAEYLPVFLILFSLLELNKGLSVYTLHLVGALFVAARVAHAAQLSLPDSVPQACRQYGFLTTAGLLAFLGLWNLISYTTTPSY